ncbi:scavenger receptor class B member 1-like [Achroia grisella]|uniref:scavenger receptor class B member 1-like n=1 Tax=Achroia grisella TaxID=688607 RepID=UPI0027D203E3|nr:scavenger receptor class B member 1-like [Achroia grisella]XP_059057215.1 scavenger receptor class B member 1-like [Achroia grisella]XP_059057223.1 scavenger receptor class B member 1-like [Achroia grisella]
MFAERTSPTIDTDESMSSTSSTRGADERQSASDSLNSLIEGKIEEPCLEVKCSLADHCPVTCEDNPKSLKGNRKSICCNTVAQCVWGVLLLFISIGGFIFKPLDFVLKEKLNMRPGFPPFEWWADPPDEVKLRVYVFNVTNHDRFMSGLDEKINMEEIGPIVYLEKLLHSNIVFNENSTMTYTAKRYPIYLPNENTVDLNATLYVPNLALLGMSSYLHSANYFVLTAFRLMVTTHGSKFFLKKTVYEYLWDYREPILDTSKNMAPGLVPVNNMGMLARIYADFTDEVTVKIGQQWSHEEFFQIDRFRGEPQLPSYDPNECPDRIFGSSEGVMYRQHLTKKDVVLYWRKTVCKLMPLYFDREMLVDNVPVYRYNLSEIVFERITNGTDCYDTEPSLPPGLSDGSKCYFNFPMVVSYPHFYTGRPPRDQYVTGLQPNRYKHNSYIVVEPLTGTPFRSVARMQSNLRVHDISRFNSPYSKFSNLVLPLFWAEYNQEGLPSNIQWTIYFIVVILPPLSYVLLTLLLLLGCYFITKNIYNYQVQSEMLNSLLHFKSKNTETLTNNKVFAYEKEAFIKKL